MYVCCSLYIISWPQARTLRNGCTFQNQTFLHEHAAASTVVRVWNHQLKIWQKIKVTVGHFCQKISAS